MSTILELDDARRKLKGEKGTYTIVDVMSQTWSYTEEFEMRLKVWCSSSFGDHLSIKEDGLGWLGFNIGTNKEALWVQVIRVKYRMNDVLPNFIRHKREGRFAVGKMFGFPMWVHRPDLFQRDRTEFPDVILQLESLRLRVLIRFRILSNIERVKKGFTDGTSCHICGFHLEGILHILRDCPVAKDDTSIALAGGASWACLFRILVWRIWKNYNLFIFQGHPWSLREIVNNSFGWASQSFSIPKDVLSGVLDPLLEEQANGFTIFLNIDRAVRLDTGNASVEGVARDMDGQKGHERVIILSDSSDVIRDIQGSNSATSNFALIRLIQSKLKSKVSDQHQSQSRTQQSGDVYSLL
ncbi:hypothetical protein F383_28044 [Gossypium arboreum]|uniref:Reverse transcriptase n=1 Tax=Gossypium arboreum TaxID=29729 RepID=A0A0B0MUR4_GOSAR|nr:hypothetical protein F383_28044 [Gossypium arboreum]